MSNSNINTPSMENVATLYCLIGEAVCLIQYVEGALSHSITLKKDIRYPHNLSKDKADVCLKRNQSYTLGKAIQLAKDNDLFPEPLFSELRAFLDERNWLIHNFVSSNLDDMRTNSKQVRLFHRIKSISNTAKKLHRDIENDLIQFSESVGVDMSGVRAAIEQFYQEA